MPIDICLNEKERVVYLSEYIAVPGTPEERDEYAVRAVMLERSKTNGCLKMISQEEKLEEENEPIPADPVTET